MAGRLPLNILDLVSVSEGHSLEQVLEGYRSSFSPKAPTAQIERPDSMAGINVVVSPNDADAQRQWTTAQRMIISGDRQPLQPPTDPAQLSPAQHALPTPSSASGRLSVQKPPAGSRRLSPTPPVLTS